jgi:hypothetical protein
MRNGISPSPQPWNRDAGQAHSLHAPEPEHSNLDVGEEPLTNYYPRETVEFQAVTITVDGEPVTEGVEFCVTPDGERPDTWKAPTTLDAKIGVMVQGLAVGNYRVWAKILSNPEIPVVECGYFRVT